MGWQQSVSRGEEVSEFEMVMNEVRELNDRKRSDYGSGVDPLANLRASEEFGIPAWVLAQVRVLEKSRRIQAYIKGSTLKNEGVEDSLLDQIVYSIHALSLFREMSQAEVIMNQPINRGEQA